MESKGKIILTVEEYDRLKNIENAFSYIEDEHKFTLYYEGKYRYISKNNKVKEITDKLETLYKEVDKLAIERATLLMEKCTLQAKLKQFEEKYKE